MNAQPPDELGEAEQERLARRTARTVAPGILMAGVAGGIAFPILPIAGARAGLPLAFIGLILAANRIMRVVSAPAVGWLSDRFGGRRTMLVGLAVQVAVMLCYWLGSRSGHPGFFFLLGRMVHGPGSACIFVAGQALALTAGGRHHGGRASGLVRAALSVGVPLGLVAGGLLADRLGDAATFLVAALVMLGAGAAAFFAVPDLRVSGRAPVSMRAALRALGDRRLVAVGLFGFASAFVASGILLTTVVLLVDQRHLSWFGLGHRGTAGLAMAVMIVTSAACMLPAGRLGDRHDAHARIATAGLVLTIPGLLVIAATHGLAGLLAGLVLVGAGTGGVSPSLLAMVGKLAPGSRGLAVGGLQLWSDAGGSLGPLVGTALFSAGVAVPYLVGAAVIAAFVPLALAVLRAQPR
jgi:MFS family permease